MAYEIVSHKKVTVKIIKPKINLSFTSLSQELTAKTQFLGYYFKDGERDTCLKYQILFLGI